MRILFPSLALLISLFAVPATHAADQVISQVQLQNITSAQQEGENILLKEVQNGAILFSAQIIAAEENKLVFHTPAELPKAPILKWKISGVNQFLGNTTLQRTDNGYAAVMSGDPQWQGQIEAFALLFPFTTDEVRLSPSYSAEKAGLGDALAIFFQPELIKPFTINLLYGHQLFGGSMTKIFGWLLVIISLGVWIVFFDEKNRQKEFFLISLSILWMLFDLRFDSDIWANAKIAQNDLKNGNYFTVTGFLPILQQVSEAVPHQIGKKVEFIGPDWPYRQYTEYELLPTKLTRNEEKGEYLFLYQTPFSMSGSMVMANEKEVCENCTLLFEKSEAALFQRK